MVLSIIIPNHNGKNLIRDCLNSIFRYSPIFDYEIIVVDNASDDGSLDMIKREFPQVLLLSNQKNMGFSYANNQGVRISRGKYILLLNSDTLVLEKSLDLMIEFLDKNPHVDICGPKLLWRDGTLQRSTQTFPTLFREFLHANPIFKKIYRGDKSLSHKILFLFLDIFNAQWASFIDYNKIIKVDQVTGAAFMFRRSLIDKVGLFDENYFMYVEEADYCCSLREKGGSVYYYPGASIVHLLGQSTKQDFKKGDWIANPFLVERYKSMLYFFKKHYSRTRLYLLKLVILEGYLLRLIFNLLRWLFFVKKRNAIKEVIRIYGTIIKLAFHYK